MGNLILKTIKNFRQFFIGLQIVSLMTVIVISNKLISRTAVDVNACKNYSKDQYLELYGSVKEAKNWETWPLKNIEGAEIIIFNTEYKVLEKLYSDENGMSVIKLLLNDQFVIRVSKEGYITKTINIDTRLSENKLAHYYINFEIDMFEDIPGLDVNVLTKPVASVTYNNYLNCFDYDFKVTDAINEKLKKKYVVYYKHHPEGKMGQSSNSVKNTNNNMMVKNTSAKPSKNNTTTIIRNTPTDISKSKTEVNQKSDNTNKNYLAFGKTAIKKSGDGLNDTSYNDPKNSLAKNNSKAISDNVLPAAIDSSQIVFKIQILSIDEYLTPDAKLFKKFGKVNEYIHEGKHKYTIGEFKTFASASKSLNEINMNGYKDAFLVAFHKGQRISIDDAKAAKFMLK